MKKIIMIALLISLVRLFSIFEIFDFGEPVKFGNNIYLITGGVDRGLVATKVIGF